MHGFFESLLRSAVPATLVALACTSAPGVAQAAKSRLQPQVVKEGESVGYRVKHQSLQLAPISLDVSKFAFTAPGRLDSAKADTGHSQVMDRGFTFTPSRSAKNGVSVGMNVRTITPDSASQTSTDSRPVANGYDFDLSLGFKGFAVSGGTSRVDTGIGGRNLEGVDLGIGYGTRNWRAGLQASSERESINLMPRPEGENQRYTVEARGALDLTSKVSVGGTLRYRPAPQNPTLLDPQGEDRAVIVGGAVRF